MARRNTGYISHKLFYQWHRNRVLACRRQISSAMTTRSFISPLRGMPPFRIDFICVAVICLSPRLIWREPELPTSSTGGWVMGQSRKLVAAIVKPIRLEDVLETLARVGIHAVTVTETKDYGQRGPTEIYRGLQYTPKFLPMLKIEAAVPSDRVESVTAAIVRAART